MVTKTQDKGKEDKPKAQPINITQLVVLSAYAKTFSTGKTGFFGKVLNPATGERFQITAAVKIG